jgi:hypothetical protein
MQLPQPKTRTVEAPGATLTYDATGHLARCEAPATERRGWAMLDSGDGRGDLGFGSGQDVRVDEGAGRS